MEEQATQTKTAGKTAQELNQIYKEAVDEQQVFVKVFEFVDELNKLQAAELKRQGYTNNCFFNEDGSLTEYQSYKAKITGKKYFHVNVGGSGKYLVDKTTGEIWGIKAYGVRNVGKFRGHVQHWQKTTDKYGPNRGLY